MNIRVNLLQGRVKSRRPLVGDIEGFALCLPF